MTEVVEHSTARLIRVFYAIVLLFAGWQITGRALPFEPFRPIDYIISPPEGCNHELVPRIIYNYDVPFYAKVTEDIPYQSNSLSSAGWSTELQPFVLHLEELSEGRNNDGGHGLRAVPDEPGTYQIYSKYVVTGEVLGIERESTVDATSTQSYRVVECVDVE